MVIVGFLGVEKGLVGAEETNVYETHLRVPISQVLLFLGLQTQPVHRKHFFLSVM